MTLFRNHTFDMTISKFTLFSHKSGRRSITIAPTEMAVVSFESSFQDNFKDTKNSAESYVVVERRAFPYPRSGPFYLSGLFIISAWIRRPFTLRARARLSVRCRQTCLRGRGRGWEWSALDMGHIYEYIFIFHVRIHWYITSLRATRGQTWSWNKIYRLYKDDSSSTTSFA